jgi:hypothetical protein
MGKGKLTILLYSFLFFSKAYSTAPESFELAILCRVCPCGAKRSAYSNLRRKIYSSQISLQITFLSMFEDIS